MKNTLSTREAADALFRDENASWTYEGARAMAEYLEEMEADTGEQMELDVVAIRCEFSEYQSAVAAANDYQSESLGDESAALEYLREKTTVIEFDGGIIIQQF